MLQELNPVAPSTLPCKCCGSEAKLFGVADFNHHCSEGAQVLDPIGVPVYYHRCRNCGFMFTGAFDKFTQDDFARLIYNAQYALVDPEYADARPRRYAAMIAQYFGRTPNLRILDYGGGNGILGDFLRALGFKSVQTYDPFVPKFSRPPEGKFDLIVSFEVAEHTPKPSETFADMERFMDDAGMIFFSTKIQPTAIEQLGMKWWYIGPRNGHVSFYTRQALASVTGPLGLNLAWCDDSIHLLFRKIPDFARHLFGANA
jgi:hypothetical protein